jgi:hypothetical protein
MSYFVFSIPNRDILTLAPGLYVGAFLCSAIEVNADQESTKNFLIADIGGLWFWGGNYTYVPISD